MLSNAHAILRQAAKPFLLGLAGLSIGLAVPAAAQIETIDPNAAIDGDLAGGVDAAAEAVDGAISASAPSIDPQTVIGEEMPGDPPLSVDDAGFLPPVAAAAATQAEETQAGVGYSGDLAPGPLEETDDSATYQQDDLIGAAEGVFGKGAEGLAGLIQDILKDQGEPNAYIVGREGGGAFIVGVRYGSGTLHHKIEGERSVYWTGPSIGLDAGANVGSTFVLVYNLWDSEDLYKRFPAGEGQAYLVGGMNASYLRRGDVVMIPIRVGAGLRLGVNAGYMRFSKKQRWLPF